MTQRYPCTLAVNIGIVFANFWDLPTICVCAGKSTGERLTQIVLSPLLWYGYTTVAAFDLGCIKEFNGCQCQSLCSSYMI